ncbi:hypothetical protein AYI69_g287 [Smittium culicis]|uniref:Uncharacterized protein n=1 Tax=Smittium culicis TaxID=133412 RepID=A0A1R1YTH3_9FUNG|nr:hypothetical protein AYI69_g287 [Smittium culicis]
MKLKEFTNKNIDIDIAPEIEDVVKQFSDILVSELEELGATKIIEHEIDTRQKKKLKNSWKKWLKTG